MRQWKELFTCVLTVKSLTNCTALFYLKESENNMHSNNTLKYCEGVIRKMYESIQRKTTIKWLKAANFYT